MTPTSPLWLRVIEVVCSEELRANILAPAVADLAYLRSASPMTPWRVLVEYWRIALSLLLALPGDLLRHHRPSRGTILRTVVAIAFPGLTPSFGATSFGDDQPRRKVRHIGGDRDG